MLYNNCNLIFFLTWKKKNYIFGGDGRRRRRLRRKRWKSLVRTYVSNFAKRLDYGANVTKSGDEEGYGLEEKVYKVVVLPVNEVIASAEEQKKSESQLQSVKSMALHQEKEKKKTECQYSYIICDSFEL